MGELFIRLNNKFVSKKDKDYYDTTITKVSEWNKMTKKQKERCIDKKVTKIIKPLLKKHRPKHNINFKTTPTKKRIKVTKRKKVKGG